MVRTLILHAGLPKCGSSSIQRSLFAARKVLASRGVVYWDIGPNHSEPLKALSQGYFRAKLPQALRARYGSPDRIEQALREALSRPSEFTILSAEGMGRVKGAGDAAAPKPQDARGRLRAAVLGAGFDRLRIVTYVRPPVAWWESLVQQRAKSNSIADALRGTTSYRALIEPLETLFPEAEKVLRLFDPAAFPGGSLLLDFAAAAGLGRERLEGVAEIRANPSLSAEATALLDRLQRQAGGEQPIGKWFVEHYLRPNLDSGRRFRLPRDVLEALIEENREDIAWISARLGRDLTPDLSDRTGEDAAGDASGDAVAALILHLLRDLGELKSRESLRAARVALEAGEPAAARRKLVRALGEWPANPDAAPLLDALGRDG